MSFRKVSSLVSSIRRFASERSDGWPSYPPPTARYSQCTAEHLLAQQEGGKDTRGNIAAACWTCNQRRHRRKKLLTPEAFKALVRRKVAAGKWWPSTDSATAKSSYRMKPASKGPKQPPDSSMLH
ncbi:HNH endonuclease signature motif containing protein [Xanthomonas phaseoli]|uniref:HNH endonuclease signature motif containing protein n=1 Tax=Xanthomonas phaseoli TaxID=1985254 RepID=UPI001E3F6843|nr:HNH endonuclease signature motif containing protein [Xanthomonas phaseoli]MCC8470482.1 HNH endonuclease [Xanthomonas phaseoli]